MPTQLNYLFEKINFFFGAYNSKGHGMHSPFVYQLITEVFNDNRKFHCFEEIEKIFTSNKKLNHKKVNELLFKMVDKYNHQSIVEIGNSNGISTAYLASANLNATIISFQINKTQQLFIHNNFETLALKNIIQKDIVELNYAEEFAFEKIDLLFISEISETTIHLINFQNLLVKCHNHSFIIINKIHCSKVHSTLWNTLIKHPSITSTVDIFDIGIAFLNPNFKAKQHFKVRF